MRTTLFYIPHRIDGDPTGLPLFGLGWLLILWLIFCAAMLVWTLRTKGWSKDVTSTFPVLLIVAAVIAFVLPMLEAQHPFQPDGEPLGLPIRGYGVMVLLGVVAGVGLAAQRAGRMGVDPEKIFSLAFWMFVFGIVGARLAFVLENWESQFSKETLAETVKAVASVTEGGLVVYGALIGATAGFLIFVVRQRLPLLAVADLIAPSMLVGLSLGRIGCLLNGCCWGGVCDDPSLFQPLAITFPSADPPTARFPLRPTDSPPYQDHRNRGLLQAVTFGEDKQGMLIVSAVYESRMRDADSESSRALATGDRVRAVNGYRVQTAADAFAALKASSTESPGQMTLETVDGREYRWKLPRRSLPVYPTQIFSSVNAALIAIFLWFYYPFRRRDGEVIALTLTIYPVSRFLLERIRVDVPPTQYLGVALTTSQWISVVILLAVVLFWIFLLRRPRGSALPPPATSPQKP